MGQDPGSWFFRSSPLQLPDLNCKSIPSDTKQTDYACPLIFPPNANSYACKHSDSVGRIVPGFPVSQFPQAWDNCYVNHFGSSPKSIFEGRSSSVCPQQNCEDATPHDARKSYLVFDRSGNQVTMISIGYPLQAPHYTNVRPLNGNIFSGESVVNREPIVADPMEKLNWSGVDENHGTDASGSEGREMCEDTEELDALLCSDFDDEEISTGHSPFEMMGCKMKEVNDNPRDAYTLTPTKKRRLDRGCDPSLVDTASSVKAWEYEGDAESSCMKGTDRPAGDKQMKKKRIRETVGILRSIIPGGKGKDAAVVLDEAIRYLKSLKLKAKALGPPTTTITTK